MVSRETNTINFVRVDAWLYDTAGRHYLKDYSMVFDFQTSEEAKRFLAALKQVCHNYKDLGQGIQDVDVSIHSGDS